MASASVPFKANLCVYVDCCYEDKDGRKCSSSGREFHNVVFNSKEQYLKCAEEFDVESLFGTVIDSIREGASESYKEEGNGNILKLDCEFSYAHTELDENFDPFDESDFDPVELEIIDNVLHVS